MSAVINLLILAGIALFLIIRLRSVLGTRDGFEKPPASLDETNARPREVRRDFEVIDGGADDDILDHVADGSDAAKALGAMKLSEPGFSVREFLGGARGAYEMILMAYENGTLEDVRDFLAHDVYESFGEALAQREAQGLTVEASFVGLREIELTDATLDRDTGEAELTVKFVAELISVVRNGEGEIVEGSPTEIRRQRDVWTFARRLGASDPNWLLVATGE